MLYLPQLINESDIFNNPPESSIVVKYPPYFLSSELSAQNFQKFKAVNNLSWNKWFHIRKSVNVNMIYWSFFDIRHFFYFQIGYVPFDRGQQSNRLISECNSQFFYFAYNGCKNKMDYWNTWSNTIYNLNND